MSSFTVELFWGTNLEPVSCAMSLYTDIGTLRSNDAVASKTLLKKGIYVLPVFIAIIPTHLLYQKEAG